MSGAGRRDLEDAIGRYAHARAQDAGLYGERRLDETVKKAKNMKKLLVSNVIALLLLSILASTTLAAKQKQFLLKGSLEASETQQVVFPTAFVVLIGKGNATHLGKLTYTAQVELNIPTLSATASATLTAADGSTLFLEGGGQGTPTDVPGVVLITETFTIGGGTG